MKLFTKYNRINLLFTVAIFIIGSVAFSLLIHFIMNEQIDDDLLTEKDEIIAHVNQYGSLPAIENVHDQFTTYRLIPAASREQRFYTHDVWNKDSHEHESVRSIEWPVQADQHWYLVTISESLDVLEDLIQSIIIITIVLISLILIAGLLINRVVLKRLWQPFYNTMHTVQKFQLHDAGHISLESSSIDEFDLMNTTLEKSLNKAQTDYQALKKFTENASHELQTPLAVIGSKLDVLIQNQDLTESQSEAINGVYDALQGMKKLNQSLLLLAKIENRQFAEQTTIRLQDVIAEKQKQFTEQLHSFNIKVQPDVTDAAIRGNPQLIDILLNNLFSNAIRHNVTGGTLMWQLRGHQFRISNTSQLPALDERYLFTRFYKGSSGTVHHGLGLSIVKEICDVSRYTCRYEFQSPGVHSFIITW